jgi:pyridoxamine 5'-phosphate oxidase
MKNKSKKLTNSKTHADDCILSGLTPLQKFSEWFAEAQAISKKNKKTFQHPEAFVLSSGQENQISSRVLLMKEIRKDGLIFYSNYTSRKGRDMQSNPNVALNFFWQPLFRQVNFRGTIQKLSKAKSLQYWRIRPRESQISQYVSQQSQPVQSRELLDQLWMSAENKFKGKEIPLPKNWGGYLFLPTYVEFWIGREGRFHDRHTYTLKNKKWQYERLFP